MAFLLVLLLVILYSFIFKTNNHPIPALLTQLTGLVPPSKGLSAAFSQIVRFNFAEAQLLNSHAMRVFSFFFVQLIMRLGIVLVTIKFQNLIGLKVILADIMISLLLFIYCFYPLIEFTFKVLLQLIQ
ncbi:MAG: hypothetical protein AB1777_05475 [Bacteroidota bacterium]